MQTVSFSNCFRSFEASISDHDYDRLKAGEPFDQVFDKDFIRNLNIRFYGRQIARPLTISVWKGPAFGIQGTLIASS